MLLDPRQAFEVLERTPALFRTLLSGLSEPWLRASEGPDTFSPVDVLGHLIHGEQTDWLPRLRIILTHGEAQPFTPFDRFGFREVCRGRTLDELLDLFQALRTENLAAVRAFLADGAVLERKGRHPALGPVSVGELLAAWVVHDLGHVKQVARVLAGEYREAVGPFREYLTILDRP
jgi:hypothetical protein